MLIIHSHIANFMSKPHRMTATTSQFKFIGSPNDSFRIPSRMDLIPNRHLARQREFQLYIRL